MAGGRSERLGQDKGLVKIAGKPLITHVYDRVRGVVQEVIVVVNSVAQKDAYLRVLLSGTRILIDTEDTRCPLVGALTGLAGAQGDSSCLLPCDTPFISKKVLELLFEISKNVDAVIPRWPNGYIEPLQAVYRTHSALSATRDALKKGETRMLSMIQLLRRVRYLSTIVIEEMNPNLTTFFNINTRSDLGKAEKLFETDKNR